MAAVSFSTLALSAGKASAEYVCQVEYIPGNTTQGAEGYVLIRLNNAKACTGSDAGSKVLCTGGATSRSCSSNTEFRYERQGLLAVFGALQRQAADNKFLSIGNVTCLGGGGSFCAGTVTFTGQ